MSENSDVLETSSVQEGQEIQEGQETDVQYEDQSSAETKKTEPGPIPYNRFKEVNDELKSLKESQDWQGYTKLKQALESDPRFSEYFTKTISSFYNNTGNKPEEVEDLYSEYPEEIAEPLRKTKQLEETVQNLTNYLANQKQEVVFNQYKSSFNEKMKDVPEHWRAFVEKRAYEIGGSINKNALAQYDNTLVDKVWEMVNKEIETIRRSERESYINEKKNDKLPVSSKGPAGNVNRIPQTENERTQLVEELLKASLE